MPGSQLSGQLCWVLCFSAPWLPGSTGLIGNVKGGFTSPTSADRFVLQAGDPFESLLRSCSEVSADFWPVLFPSILDVQQEGGVIMAQELRRLQVDTADRVVEEAAAHVF